MKYILSLLFVFVVSSCFSQDIWKHGPIAKDTRVRDLYGGIWQARAAMTNSVSPPTAGAYWTYLGFGKSIIDSLQLRIIQLERPFYANPTHFVGDGTLKNPLQINPNRILK